MEVAYEGTGTDKESLVRERQAYFGKFFGLKKSPPGPACAH